MLTEQEARDVKRRHSAELLSKPGVSGVGVEKDEDGNFVIAVHLDATTPGSGAVAENIEGFPVKFVAVARSVRSLRTQVYHTSSLKFITLNLHVAGFLRISFGILDGFQA